MKKITIEIDTKEVEHMFISRCNHATWTHRTDNLVVTTIDIINDFYTADQSLQYNAMDIDQIIYILSLLKQPNGHEQLVELFKKAKIPVGFPVG